MYNMYCITLTDGSSALIRSEHDFDPTTHPTFYNRVLGWVKMEVSGDISHVAPI